MTRKLVLVFTLLTLAAPALVASKDRNPWKDLYVQVDDIKIHYLEAGTGDRPLVFIPGWTMAAEVWKEQIPYFAARGFRVIAFDPRSQGLTTKTDGGNTYRQQAADLHAFLKTLGLEHSYLVGWSAGVIVLLEYLSSPETLQPEKVVFVDGFPAALKADDYPGAMTVQQARTLLLGFQDDRAKAADKFVRSMFKAHQPESIYKELTDASLKTPVGAAFSFYFDLLTGDRRGEMAHVPVPSLILVTQERRMIGEYMQSKTPRSKLEVIEGAGHAMFLDKPQAFNQILEDFLGQH